MMTNLPSCYTLLPRALCLTPAALSVVARGNQGSLITLNTLDLASQAHCVHTSSAGPTAAIHTSASAKKPVLGTTDLGKDLTKPSPTFGEIAIDEVMSDSPVFGEGMCTKDQALVQLYVAACNHYWHLLPELADVSYARGATEAEVQGAIRHVIVFGGYAPCLAATITLRKAGKLAASGEHQPGKVNGAPGNAFELVYDKVTDKVRDKLHSWDPVLAEWIRLHLYGDVYSSPGLTMKQKQLLTCAFLGEANMHDQLYTHLIAALRFGATQEACRQAVKIGFHMSARPAVVLRTIANSAFNQLDQAVAKFARAKEPACEPTLVIPDPSSVRVPSRTKPVAVTPDDAADKESC